MSSFIDLPEWTNRQFLGIQIVDLIYFTIITGLMLLVLPITVKLLLRSLEKISNIPELLHNRGRTEKRVKPWFYIIVAVFIGSFQLSLPEKLRFILSFSCSILILIQFLIIASHWIKLYLQANPLSKSSKGQVSALNQTIATLIILSSWVLSIILLLDNFGFNVATLVAGLGVGGIAVGLALQSVFGDFLASFSIGLDKPFELGDFIIVGDFMGNVEKVGLKTTQLRSLGGELLVFPNHDLVNSRLRNYNKMKERRIVFKLGVTYDTDQEILETIPQIIKSVIDKQTKARFDRSHFSNFGDFSLNFESVYYVLSEDYNIYMDVQQKINFGIRREFINQKISFAFPTTTVDLPEKNFTIKSQNNLKTTELQQ